MKKYIVFRKKDKSFERCFDDEFRANLFIKHSPEDYIVMEVEV